MLKVGRWYTLALDLDFYSQRGFARLFLGEEKVSPRAMPSADLEEM